MAQKKNKKEGEEAKGDAGVGVSILKELTHEFIVLRQMTAKQINQGAEQMGLTQNLIESIDSLDVHVTGASFMLSRINFVFDKMVEIQRGDPKADPPVEGRSPELDDITTALDEFDRAADEAAKEAEKEEAEEAEEAEEETPDRPQMFSQTPPVPKLSKTLPPLPRVAPLKK